MLILLDKAFFAFHALLIAFNLTGWAWRRTRPWHLVALGLTACSWFVLGAFYGWGYCVCTDWHFRLRRHLGYVDPETSYVQLLLRRVAGLSLERPASDRLAMGTFGLIVILTAIAWARDGLRRRRRAITHEAGGSSLSPSPSGRGPG